MKKQLLLTLCLMMSLLAFSQSDTINFAEIVKDLHRLDYLEEVHQADSLKISIFAGQLSLKDSIIKDQTQQVLLCDSIQSVYVRQTDGLLQEQKKLKRKVKSAEAGRNVVGGVSGIAIILLLL